MNNDGEKGYLIKSPSDSTLYTPALRKIRDPEIRTPPFQGSQQPQVTPQVYSTIDKISNFVEQMRIESTRSCSQERDATSQDHCRGDRSESSHRQVAEKSNQKQAKELADKMILDVEQFKTSVAAPQGNQIKNIFSDFSEYVKVIADNDDDEFFHITAHVDHNLKSKIEKGEYVDLERLMPRDRVQQMQQINDSEAKLVQIWQKNGEMFLTPRNREYRINSVKRWEQAFRVYAAIYSSVNPHHLAEIWQYVYTINNAASAFSWDSVAYYDYHFRHLMHTKPNRSWGKIYSQLWNIAFKSVSGERNNSNYGNHGQSTSGNGGKNLYGDWRDNCCWRFNKGNQCAKWNCRYDH